ncbi:MAG TPA: acylphosphatase [Thermoflexales bacterium]|nr:acylphosphatase [Thermoflexales bacterium]HQZ22255.1 acylphosphatase [Thermoflexales bacterium]
MKIRLTATIKGRVQGVGFRVSAMEKAASLGLTGWVRNEWNRDVQTLAEGTQENLEAYLAWLHRGPIGARVTSVNASWGAATGEFEGFEITG